MAEPASDEAAVKRATEMEKALAAAKQEQARWRARSDAQTSAKTFLLLESLFLFLVKVDDFDALLIHEPALFDLEFLVSLK